MAKNKHKMSRQNKGYSEVGASHSRKALKSFDAQSGSPNEDINYNLQTLRRRSRVLYMSGGLAASALKTNRTNVIGCGLILKSVIDREELGLTEEQAKAWQDKAEKEFEIWAENKYHCDALGMNDYYTLQQLVFMSSLMNGDCFTLVQRDEMALNNLMPYSLRLNVIEADRIQTPCDNAYGALLGITDGKTAKGNRIFDGIEVNKNGKVVACHIRNNYSFETNSAPTVWQRVEFFGKKTGLFNVIHTMADVERPGQYRGVPFIAAVIEPILQIRRYTDTELTAAVVESLFTAFIKTEADTSEMPFNEVEQDEERPLNLSDDEYEMGPGSVQIMKPGEDVVFADPKRPAGGFQNFVEAVSVQIGAALEIPKELLLKQFNSSYSASRAALLEFWKVVKMRREWFVADFCRPVYELFIYEAVARGRLKAPGFFNDPIKRKAWLGAEFVGPSQGMLDPIKEITAEAMMCENGFSTRADSAIRLTGSEFFKNIGALKTENQGLAEANAITPSTKELLNEYLKAYVMENLKNEGNDEEENK